MSSMQKAAQDSTLKALAQIEGKNAPSKPAVESVDPGVSTAKAEPYVAFSIEKKVGDAKILASGPAGSEAKARELVNEAVERLKGKSSDE